MAEFDLIEAKTEQESLKVAESGDAAEAVDGAAKD